MPEKIKYNIAPQSKAPLISSLISLCSVVLLCVVYWPVFVQYFAGGIYDGPKVGVVIVVFYGSLILGLLFYSILTGVFAKKTLMPSAIFALAPSLFYILDLSGLRNVIMFFDADKTFSLYSEKAYYFGAAWPFITILTLLTILSAVCYFMLSANRRRGFATTFITLNSAGWLAFSVYYIVVFAAPDFASNSITARDFAYTIMTNTAAALFFVSQFVVAAALKKAAPAQPAEAASPVALDGSGGIDLLSVPPTVPPPVPVENNNFSSQPAAEMSDAGENNETAVDTVINTDRAETENPTTPESPEQTATPEVANEAVEPEIAAESAGNAGELSATDIDVLAAVDSGDSETATPDTVINADTEKPAPKKKTPAKKPGKQKKDSAKKDNKTNEQQNENKAGVLQ